MFSPSTRQRRSTPLKQAILELLEHHHLLTAPQLLEKLHKAGHPVNKTSVYRNLETFLADNVICQQAFGDEFVYELQHDHHDHLKCNMCGKVVEVPCQLEAPKSIQGFQVDHHHLTLYGVCQDCAEVA